MRFAIITNGTVINVIEATADFAESIGAVFIPDEYGIGDKCVDGLWEYGEKPAPESLLPEPVSEIVDIDQILLEQDFRLSMLEINA